MPFPPSHPGLLQALAERGYAEPTPVQAAVLEAGLAGRDLLVSAQTGSGKTVAFGLAMAPRVLGDAERLPARTPIRALVIAPTRELALQVQRELHWLYARVGARVVACVGGMDPRQEARTLAAGATIVVGTPGRLRDHLERRNFSLAEVEVVVLDEADEMLDMGFREELEALLEATPTERQTLMFSATIPRQIAALAKAFQRDAARIATTSDEVPHGDIEYRAITVMPRERDLAVVNVLRYFEAPGALVFCATRDGVNHLASNLLERGFAVVALSGELSQAERNRALTALRDGRARVCVATDVAARGLDLPDLGLVIHADLPRDKQTLLHRSGRTGRAGKKGSAVIVVPAPFARKAEQMFGAARIDAVWSDPPAADQIRARDEERLVAEIAALAADVTEEDQAAARALLAERSAEAIAAALVHLRRTLKPAPEELTPIGSMRSPARGTRPERPEPTSRPARLAPDAHVRLERPSERPQPRAEREPQRSEPAERPERAPRPTRAPAGGGEMVWFRLAIGRTNNADPRWLIPMLCKRGGITKAEIGAIRIQFRETLVEIDGASAADFAASVARTAERGVKRDAVRIEQVDRGPAAAPPRRR